MTCIPEKTGFLLWPGMVLYTGQQRMGKKKLIVVCCIGASNNMDSEASETVGVHAEVASCVTCKLHITQLGY